MKFLYLALLLTTASAVQLTWHKDDDKCEERGHHSREYRGRERSRNNQSQNRRQRQRQPAPTQDTVEPTPDPVEPTPEDLTVDPSPVDPVEPSPAPTIVPVIP